MYQPKTGAKCSCKKGVQRDNCATCEGTGLVIDFNAIRNKQTLKNITSKEHFEKYNAIVSGTQSVYLSAVIVGRLTKERIINELTDGESNSLNTIPLPVWDGMAPNVRGKYTLAERVCALKHVAIYHVAGFEPEFKD